MISPYMTQKNVKQGLVLINIVTGLLLGISLFVLLLMVLGGTPIKRLVIAFIRLFLGIGLLIMLYKGRQWARWLIVVLSLLSGIQVLRGAMFFAKLNASIEIIFMLSTASLVYLVAGLVLTFSSRIKAFMRYKKGYSLID